MFILRAAPGTTFRPDAMTFIGVPRPAGSLAEFFARTPVVLLGTAGALRPPEIERDSEVVSSRSFEIDEVLKDDSGVLKPGVVVTLKQGGGTVVVNGRAFQTRPLDEPALLPPGVQAVLFLAGGPDAFVLPDPYADASSPSTARGTSWQFPKRPPGNYRSWADAVRSTRTNYSESCAG